MKVRVTMKTPDALQEAVEREAANFLSRIGMRDLDIPKEDQNAVLEAIVQENMEACVKWFEYGELVTIELCTDSMTATVVELRDR